MGRGGAQYNKEQNSAVGRGHNKIKNSTVQWGGDRINKEQYSTVGREHNKIKSSTVH